jgi:hypothetical protein
MLSQLSTIKTRLAISDADTTYDTLLTNALKAVSARFDLECNRTLERTVDAAEEFGANDMEIPVACYPIETVTGFDLKTNETGGWVRQSSVEHLVRRGCLISLASPLGVAGQQARVIYTGGYLSPGQTGGGTPPPVALPSDLEQAAVEQVVFWYQTRDHVGVARDWPKGGNYQQYQDLDLLPTVRSVLLKYQRWAI